MVGTTSNLQDFDGDGVADRNDICPGVAATTDANDDGCQDRAARLTDADGDGIPAPADRCPNTPRGNDPDGDGCPAVVVTPPPPPVAPPPPPPIAEPSSIVFIFGYEYLKSTNKFTKFNILQLKALPVQSIVKVTCKGPRGKKCPGGKSFSKSNAFGTVNLKKWKNKKLRAGTKLTATVTKAGNFIGSVKVFTVRKKKAPKISTKCLPPGATKAVSC